MLSMTFTGTVYLKFQQSLVSKATLNLQLCFLVVEIVLTNSNTPIWKAWGSVSRAQRPLTMGIVRRQFPSLSVTTWRNNGRSAWNDSRFEHMRAFYVEITNIHGVKLKMSCYNHDQDWSVRVCCPNALGLVRTVRQIPRANVLRIWLLASHAPSCIGTTNPSRTGLNPLRVSHDIFHQWMCMVHIKCR